jgi:hypothetical protein
MQHLPIWGIKYQYSRMPPNVLMEPREGWRADHSMCKITAKVIYLAMDSRIATGSKN